MGQDTIESDFYANVTERYDVLDISRSRLKFSADPALADRVSELIEEATAKPVKKRVKLVRNFYDTYLKDRLKHDSAPGTKMDLSTLVIAAESKSRTSFGHASLMILADQIYHLQEKRKRLPFVRFIAPLLNLVLSRYDERRAHERKDYEIHAHVMVGEKGLEKIEESRKIGEEVSEMIDAMSDVSKESTGKFVYPHSHPDCNVPTGYIRNNREMDYFIAKLHEELDALGF